MRFADYALRNHRSFIRGVAWVFLGEFSSKCAIIITTFAAARTLTPPEFAIFTGFLAIVLTAAAIGDAGLSQLVVIEVASGRTSARAGLRSVLRQKRFLLPLWALVFWSLSYVLVRNQDVGASIVVGYGLTSLVALAQISTVAILRGMLRFREAAIATAVGRWVTALAVFVAAITSFQPEYASRTVALATLVGEAIILCLSVWLLRADLNAGSGSRQDRVTVRRSIPFAANDILSLAYNRLDVVIVAALASGAQLTIYAPASRIQDAFYIIPTVITAIMVPAFSKAFAQRTSWLTTNQGLLFPIGAALAVSIPTLLIIALATPLFIELILGEDYLASTLPTRILICSIPFAAANAILIARLAAGPRPSQTTWVFLTAFVVSSTMHLLLDSKYGATGAAIASLARDPAALGMAAFLVKRSTMGSGH